jgi:hypothetical protein
MYYLISNYLVSYYRLLIITSRPIQKKKKNIYIFTKVKFNLYRNTEI